MLPPRAFRWWFALALLAATPAWATFTDIGAAITGVNAPAVAWGDYDADGDLDFVMTGTTVAGDIARIYRNNGGTFSDAFALPADAATHSGAVAWGDFDHDGDLDLALAGARTGGPITRIYRNDSGTFADIGAGLPGVSGCALAWVDFDNDGDLDLALAGDSGAGAIARIYRNTHNTFADAAAAITGLTLCAMAWGDYDNDGDFDVAICGVSGTTPVTSLYRNSGGVFTQVIWSVQGVSRGSVSFGDFDNDGDLDLLISGGTTSPPITRIYRNTAGLFADANAVMQGIFFGASIWGDADNDGDLDIALAGTTGSTGYAAVYLNTGTGMSDMNAGLASVSSGALAWGDYDNDADLDLLLAGNRSAGGPQSASIYRNSGAPANSPPAAPGGLFVTTDSVNVTFHWNIANDAQSGGLGLSYNLWAGTAPGSADVLSPMANLATGFRLVPQRGNADENLLWTLPRSAFNGSQVHWGVQAIDQAFAGSAFATGPHLSLDVCPSGWWKAEGDANDAAGTSHGTLRNGATFVGGRVGQAFSLDGIDAYVDDLGSPSTFSFMENTGVFTVEAWIGLDDANASRSQTISANIANSTEKGHYFGFVNNAGQHGLQFALGKGGGDLVIDSRSPEGVVLDAFWHHVAATGNGTNVTFYVDGVPYPGSGTMGTRSSGASSRAVDVGWDGVGSHFGGQLDELAIYDRELSASEIQANYNTGTGARCALVSVGESRADVPMLALSGPRPNPASHRADFEFQLPLASTVAAQVVDITGRRVASLLRSAEMPAGPHRLHWDCRDRSGRRVAPGVYQVRLTSGAGVAFRRVVVIN